MKGKITGTKDQPALLENVFIVAGSELQHVTLGQNVYLPEDVILGEGVRILEQMPTEESEEDGKTQHDGLDIIEKQFEETIEVCDKPLDNHAMLSRAEAKALNLKTNIDVEPQHKGQQADVLMVVRHENQDGQTDYMRVGESWEVWDQQLSSLEPAISLAQLPEKLNFPIFEGDLSHARGELTFYSGYRLDTGSIVYNGLNPMHFSIDSSPDKCMVYAVHDEDLNDSQFVKVDLSDSIVGDMQPLGPEYPGYDIEGLAINPNNAGALYATAGDDANVNGQELDGYLYIVSKRHGEVRPIGATGYEQVAALTTHPLNNRLWGWAINEKQDKWMGLITIDPKTGKGTPFKQFQYHPDYDITDIAWHPSGDKLYASTADKIWVYSPDQQELEVLCNNVTRGEIEGLDIQPNGLLLLGIDYHKETASMIMAYDPEQCRMVNMRIYRHTRYYDLESIVWPVAECNDQSWLNEDPCKWQ